jgi:hypothetical protein
VIKQVAIALGLLIGIALPSLLRAQFYNGSQMTFGKNRVQYGEFLWSYFRFDEFETYFYLNGKELAIFTAEYARIQIPRMQARLETASEKRSSLSSTTTFLTSSRAISV